MINNESSVELGSQADIAKDNLAQFRKTVSSVEAAKKIGQLTELFNPATMSLEKFFLAQNLIKELIAMGEGNPELLNKLQNDLDLVAKHAKVLGVDMSTPTDIEPSDQDVLKVVSLNHYLGLSATSRATLRNPTHDVTSSASRPNLKITQATTARRSFVVRRQSIHLFSTQKAHHLSATMRHQSTIPPTVKTMQRL